MKHKHRIISVFLLSVAFLGLSCTKQTAQTGNRVPPAAAAGAQAQTPTEAYKMLYAAVKAKDPERIKQMMTKNTLGLAEFNANNQKITVEKSVENGLVAPTLSPTLNEIRDERVKGNFGAIEVLNAQTNRWEDLPFMLEDGGWKLAVGDVFKDTYKSPGKGKTQIEREASNTGMMSSNSVVNFPPVEANKAIPANSGGTKSIEVPKEDKPKK